MAIYCYSCLAEASVTAFGIGQRLLRLFATNPPIRRPPPTESQVHFCLFVGLSSCHILTQTQASHPHTSPAFGQQQFVFRFSFGQRLSFILSFALFRFGWFILFCLPPSLLALHSFQLNKSP